MLVGYCGSLDKMEQIRDAGFDYMEPSVSGIAALTDTEFEEQLEHLRQVGLPTPSFNVLFPGTLSLTMDDQVLLDYLEPAFARLERMGGKIVVFGSSGFRKRPEGMSYQECFTRLVEVTRLIGNTAQRHGLFVTIEPLNRKETNMVNSLAEGACVAAAAAHPAVGLLADYYHVTADGEPLQDIIRLGALQHTHIATHQGRRCPTQPEEGFVEFFKALKQIGYSGRVSVEGGCDDLPHDGPLAAALLRNLWEQT